MAYRRNNYRRNYSGNYQRRKYGYRSSRPYRVYTRVKNNQAFRFVAPWTWLAGCAVGLLDFDDKIPAELKVGIGNMPLSGSVGGRARNLASGLCFGDLLQKNLLPRVGIRLGSVKQSDVASTGVKVI